MMVYKLGSTAREYMVRPEEDLGLLWLLCDNKDTSTWFLICESTWCPIVVSRSIEGYTYCNITTSKAASDVVRYMKETSTNTYFTLRSQTIRSNNQGNQTYYDKLARALLEAICEY